MAIPAILYKDFADEDRNADRYRVRFNAVRRDQGLEVQEVTVHDVSALGILLETHEHLSEGSSIRVELPDVGDKDATVVWGSGSFHGAQFSQALTKPELQRITAASLVVWPHFRDEDLPCRADRGTTAASAEQPTVDAGDEAKEKLALPVRIGFVIGGSTLLWAGIATGAWLALG